MVNFLIQSFSFTEIVTDEMMPVFASKQCRRWAGGGTNETRLAMM